MSNKISDAFEDSFMSRSLENEVRLCDNYELAPLFKKYLGPNQPILEAGCGTGRWVVWFSKQCWESTGIDWSSETTQKAKSLYPECSFDQGDVRDMNYGDSKFKSIVSLGTIEHDPIGPTRALEEFVRVLNDDGIIILTIPYASPIYRVLRPIHTVIRNISGGTLIRKIFKKYVIKGTDKKAAKKKVNNKWRPVFLFNESGWFFLEYHYDKLQMKKFINEVNCKIIEERVAFKDDGIFYNFGKLVGVWDYDYGSVRFNIMGKLLKVLLPEKIVGGHLCYVLKKS